MTALGIVIRVPDWTERHAGFDPAGLTEVVDRVRARGGRAQLCVLRDGYVVLDRAVNCRPDALFWLFSTSKPYVAMCVYRLAEQGRLALDEPIAGYWPEFRANGKGAITVRHVLQHRAGIPVARSMLADALAMTSWSRAVRAIEAARPVSPPGDGPAYHIISFGFILGEVVRRVSGVPVDDFLDREFLAPLGLRDTYLGLPRAALSRRVPVRASGARGTAGELFLNRRALRRAVIPAAGVSATARDLALYYQMLVQGGQLDGVRVLAPETIAEARRPSTDATPDTWIRWAQGFQLGGARTGAVPRAMGQLSSRETFGHNGSNACIAWADPTRSLVFAYVSDRVEPNLVGIRHQSAIADTLLSAYHPDSERRVT